MKKDNEELKIEKIKNIIIKSIFSDDELMSELVIKGGTAIHLLEEFYSRASMDIDLSAKNKFLDIGDIKEKFQSNINKGLSEYNLRIIDFEFKESPRIISDELAGFWGGYSVEFKIINIESYNKYIGKTSNQEISKKSISLDKKNKKVFSIDISNFEYTDSKKIVEVEGYSVYIYTVEAIIFEKIRAICQQQLEYRNMIKSVRAESTRAKDFYDIYFLSNKFNVDYESKDNFELLEKIFEAKRVPLELISKIRENRSYYKTGFSSVRDTVKGKIEEFDFYFDFVDKKCRILESFWKK
jgi:hypothetical protein